MAEFAVELGDRVGMPVLDGISCAVKIVEGLVALGLKTSKAGSYLPPRPKLFSGRMASSSFS